MVPADSVRRWLAQFAEEDRPAALLLLERIHYHSYPQLVRELRTLHRMLLARLAAAGFDAESLGDVDFSREFTCKSGDLISYLYRRANLIPTVDFSTFEALIARADRDPGAGRDRALVILDDYIGTGSQFVFQFVARSDDDIRVIGGYRRVYLCCVAAHEEAFRKGRLLQAGRFDEAIRIEEEQITCADFRPEEEAFRQALAEIDWRRIELIPVFRDRSVLEESGAGEGRAGGAAPDGMSADGTAVAVGAAASDGATVADLPPLTAEQRTALERLLDTYTLEGCEGGTSVLLGTHAFFYGAPNSLPPILLPLFKRVEDFTIYPEDTFIDITTDIIDYDLDAGPGPRIVRTDGG
ncbi:MAG: hypothetical protein FJ000_00605 [Actinobacteria bacterium]|nr:hypothetical protein [Actinomycetota bacterium]